MTPEFTLGIIGMGHIATVIARRLVEAGFCSAHELIAVDVRAIDVPGLPIVVARDACELLARSNRVLIAVRPQQFPALASVIRETVRDDQLLISIMAGMPTTAIASALSPRHPRIVRCMPNLPFERGRGVTGVFAGPGASEADVIDVRRIFDAGGSTLVIHDEAQMDVVTALAGSGPAYFYYFVEVMAKAGAALGLSHEQAQQLAAHACLGAGEMMTRPGASPRALREAVTSAGGTTEAALRELAAGPLADALTRAVEAAHRRGVELGKRL
ncbi:MAG: pyrroline-5-carboxylate reductase [Phycisphaerae bacterium]